MESQNKDAHVKNLKKHRLWTAFAVTVFAFLIIFFSPLNNSVRAIYRGAHAIDVFLRFDSKFLQKSPAGQYYRALLIKHGEEQYQIVNARPEHLDEFWQVVELFTPGVEALVNGKGDTIRVTKEQANRLNEEWEWEAQFASTTFRKDVERELERFPLDGFVGMTMNEAWNFINANWKPDPLVETAVTPIPIATPIPLVIPANLCYSTLNPKCLVEPSLITDSNGLWAYYILNRIYFETPSTWRIQKQGSGQNAFYMFPSPESPEGLSIDSLLLYAGKMSIEGKEQYDLHVFPEAGPAPKWKRSLFLTDFQGVEFLRILSTSYLEVFLYNENEQIAFDLTAVIKDAQAAALINNPDTIDEIFPNFQHIIESIRIWKP